MLARFDHSAGVIANANHGAKRAAEKTFDRQNLCAIGADNQYLARMGAGDSG